MRATTYDEPVRRGAACYPSEASENNPEAWLDALEQNPIDQSFVDSLAAFAYRSTASVLGDGADDAKANRMYSPLSLYYALALANEGAAGQTRDEIASCWVRPAPSTCPSSAATCSAC